LLEHRQPIRPALLAVCVAALISAVGCAGESQSVDEWDGTVRDSAGVTIVSNPAEGMWTEASRWTVREDLKIGAVEGDPEYHFGEVGGIAVDSRGRIFVLDAQARRIQVFSPEGEYERTAGRPGNGPGELERPGSLLIGAGDTLLVQDMGNRRVNRYAPDGSSAGSFSIVFEQGLPWAYRSTASGLIAEQRRPFALAGQPAPEDPRDAILILALDGTVTDTLMRFPSGQSLSMGGRSTVMRPYHPEQKWDLAPDSQLLFADNDEYRIGLYSPGGDLARLITKTSDSRRITDRDIEVVMAFLEAGWIRGGATPEHFPQLRDMWEFSEYFPAFQSFMAGPDGTIWVQHVCPPSEMDEDRIASLGFPEEWVELEWDVFDAEGRFLGEVAMPPRFMPLLFRGDKIYGRWRDDLGVHYVMVLKIEGLPPFEEG